jgi:putative glycosyltransferase (TIGR04372 family)
MTPKSTRTRDSKRRRRRGPFWPIRVSNLTDALPFVGSRLVQVGRHRILIVRFRPLRRKFRGSFGIHLKRLQDAIYLARLLDASLYVLWYRAAPNQAVNRLSSPDLRIIRSTPARDALVSAWWLVSSPLAALKRFVYSKLGRFELSYGRRAKERRNRRKRIRHGLEAPPRLFKQKERLFELAGSPLRWAAPARAERELELRREMAADPIRLRLPPTLEAEARAQAELLGLDPGARIITMHVRESGWRQIDEDSRSCDINTFRPAVDELVRRGFRIVRIGDASMTPIDWPGVLDLATHPGRTDPLELWSMLHSVYFLGSESGPLELAKLIGMPMLLVNVKTVQSGYPLHRSDLFIMKRLLSPDEPCVLSLREQLAVKAGKLGLGGSLRYVDNSAEEILLAVEEMLQAQNGDAPESPAQAEFRRLAGLKVIKGRECDRFLGEGRLARFFADRYLDQREPSTASGEA